MLPLLLPSDPKMLGVLPTKPTSLDDDDSAKRSSARLSVDNSSRSTSRASFGNRGAMRWRFSKHLREIGPTTLQWVDGSGAVARWTRPVEPDEEDDAEKPPPPYPSEETMEDGEGEDGELKIDTGVHLTALTRAPSGRSRGRASMAGGTPIERRDSSVIEVREVN